MPRKKIITKEFKRKLRHTKVVPTNRSHHESSQVTYYHRSHWTEINTQQCHTQNMKDTHQTTKENLIIYLFNFHPFAFMACSILEVARNALSKALPEAPLLTLDSGWCAAWVSRLRGAATGSGLMSGEL